MNNKIKNLIKESIRVKKILLKEEIISNIKTVTDVIIDALINGRKVLIFGNGGSAADAQHFAAELSGKFKKIRRALPAMALTVNPSVVTAIANDFGYERVFERQIEAHAKSGDIVIGISTSGNSNNVNLALQSANNLGCFTVGLIGKDGGKMKSFCDLEITVPTSDTPRIQEAHILIIHIICELVENKMFKNE